MADIERLTIRIQKDRLEALQKLADSGKYRDISDVVRNAIDRFLENNEDIGESDVPSLELIADDDSAEFDQAVKNAVTDYIRNRIKTK